MEAPGADYSAQGGKMREHGADYSSHGENNKIHGADYSGLAHEEI
jgi:hypothetical protein